MHWLPAPVYTGGHFLKKPTEIDHQQKAKTKKFSNWAASSCQLHLKFLSMKITKSDRREQICNWSSFLTSCETFASSMSETPLKSSDSSSPTYRWACCPDSGAPQSALSANNIASPGQHFIAEFCFIWSYLTLCNVFIWIVVGIPESLSSWNIMISVQVRDDLWNSVQVSVHFIIMWYSCGGHGR